MGAPDNANTADAIAPQGEAPPFLDATYNPRDVTIGPASGQDAAALWGENPPADDGSVQDGNGGPPDSNAATPATSDGVDNADSTDSAGTTDSNAAYDTAARQVKAQNAHTCSQAALMLNAQGGGDSVPDQVLANYFHVSLPVVAENRQQFRHAYNRNQSWRALSGCSVLPGFVVAHPQAAPAVNHDLLSWSTLEGLFSESAHNLEEGAGAIVEPIAHLGSGFFAKSVSDVAGLAATAYEAHSDEDNSQNIDGFVRYVRDSLTYQPRTEAGASPVNPLNSIPTWFGMLLNFALPNKAEDGDTAAGMFRNGIREAIPQALSIAGAKVSFVPKALREGDVSGVEGEGPAAPNSDLPPAAHDIPPPLAAHPAPKLAQPVQADLAQSVQTASNIDRVSQLLKGNRLCQENPALCSEAVQEMASQGDMHTLYVPQEAFEQVAQSRGITSHTLLDRMPETQANGGLLAIPAQEYFTALPEGMAGDLSPFVKIDPAKGSLAEVLARAKAEPVSTDGMADAKAPPESQMEATAEGEADAANAPEDMQPGAGQATTAAPTGHPLLNAEQWAKYQNELRAMSPENRAIAERFADKLRDYNAAVAEYARLTDSQGGKVLNTDIARELSEDYLKDRTKAEVVQRLASAFVRKMYADKLAATKEPLVLLSAGGPGAGKSTALAEVPALARASANADIIYDTTMSHYGSAKEMIERALQAGGDVRVVLVIREPADALLNGVIHRAVKEEKKYGSGRTVRLDYFLEAHPDAIRNVFRLAEEYRNNADVNFRFVDNTHGLGRQREVSLEQAKQIEFQQVEARAREILEQEYRDGRISKKIYTGIKLGKDVP